MDPLAQLKDIHLPADIHNYPLAPGWWLLALLILALLIFSGLKLRQFINQRKAQKTALKQLAIASDTTAVLNSVKWALLQYFPRAQVAHLSGDNLKTFLTATLPAKHQEKFQQLSANGFNNVYQSAEHSTTELTAKEKETRDFVEAAKLWLTQALPPVAAESFSNSTTNNTLAANKKTTALASENIGGQV